MFVAEDDEPSDSPEVMSCKALVSAMMVRGIRDVKESKRSKGGYGSKVAQAARRDALRWFRSNRKEPWSFRWCCEVLRIDEGVVKKYLEEFY